MDKIRKAVEVAEQKLQNPTKELNNVNNLLAKLKTYGLRDIELRPYQLEGVRWLGNHFQHSIGCILADEMGLGKTCQTISLLVYIYGCVDPNRSKQPSLILCPLSVINNWRSELARFAPHLTFVSYVGNQDERTEIRRDLKRKNVNIVLTSYDLCLKDEEFMRKFNWQVLVVDEGHRVKNRQSMLHQALIQMNFEQRILLTGTPIQNNLEELYSLLCFVCPTIFKFKYIDEFIETYRDISSDNSPKSSDISTVLEPFLLRRLKTEVLKDLPTKSEVILYHGLTALQKKYYKAILKKDIDAFDVQVNQYRPNRTRLLNVLMELRKCVAHPYLFDGVEPEPFEMGEHLVEASGKLIVVDQLLDFLKTNGHKVLIFSQMTRVLDILQDYLTYRGYPYERLDGSVRAEERFLAVNNFNADSSTFAFLLSTRAGGQGLNLTGADTVIFFDSDFNPQNDLQAAARAHRIGQQRHVKVIRLVGRSTVEEIILRRAEDKLRLTNAVMPAGTSANDTGLDMDQFKLDDIIKFGLDRLFANDDNSLEDVDFEAILGQTVDSEWQPEAVTASVLQPEEDEESTQEAAAEVDNMYLFEGKDYSKEPSAADCQALQQLVDAVKAAQLKSIDEGGRTRRSRNAPLPDLFPDTSVQRKPRKQLSPEELEQRRKQRAERAALRAKEEEEEEMRRARAQKEKLTKMWASNDYKSCGLPSIDEDSNSSSESTDDESSAAEDDVSIDAANNHNIQYVIGDVTQPQNTDNKDALIVHCVDDSGHWGRGGLFTHISNRSMKPQEQYKLAGKMKDLALGDVHIVPFDDVQSRQTGHDFVALIVAQRRDKNNVLSGLKMSALTVALQKLCKFARTSKVTVHMPRIGHNTPGFNWYGTERLIRKYLVARGVPTFVYYFARKQQLQQKRKATGSSTTSSAEGADVVEKRLKSSPVDEDEQLPDFMTGFAIYFHAVLPSLVLKLSRLVIAYNGDVHNTVQSDTTHVVSCEGAVVPDDVKSTYQLASPNVKFETVKWLKNQLRSPKINDDVGEL